MSNSVYKIMGPRNVNTFANLTLQLGIILSICACGDLLDPDSFRDCPNPIWINSTGLERVFYEPFENGKFADSLDTVAIQDFRFNIELAINGDDLDENFLIGEGFSGDCQVFYNFQNISLVQVVLASPFEDLPAGTDISFLLLQPDGTQLSRLRDFSRQDRFISTRLNKPISELRQLHTLTMLFLRNGEIFEVESKSPFLGN